MWMEVFVMIKPANAGYWAGHCLDRLSASFLFRLITAVGLERFLLVASTTWSYGVDDKR
jgi:hypothetical protein